MGVISYTIRVKALLTNSRVVTIGMGFTKHWGELLGVYMSTFPKSEVNLMQLAVLFSGLSRVGFSRAVRFVGFDSLTTSSLITYELITSPVLLVYTL